jgi:hypothetical protein
MTCLLRTTGLCLACTNDRLMYITRSRLGPHDLTSISTVSLDPWSASTVPRFPPELLNFWSPYLSKPNTRYNPHTPARAHPPPPLHPAPHPPPKPSQPAHHRRTSEAAHTSSIHTSARIERRSKPPETHERAHDRDDEERPRAEEPARARIGKCNQDDYIQV